MNCKPEDLAIIVGSRAGNNGKIIRCLRLATDAELDIHWFCNTDGPVWVIDKPLKTLFGNMLPLCRDVALRPIRDQPGNEWFFKAAPLDAKQSDRGVTIDARGEVKA